MRECTLHKALQLRIASDTQKIHCHWLLLNRTLYVITFLDFLPLLLLLSFLNQTTCAGWRQKGCRKVRGGKRDVRGIVRHKDERVRIVWVEICKMTGGGDVRD